ncbi:probable ATP-dependent RNA helicase spindle-E [Anopheles bellator]|uniref:probable ATP-dependent RNA helicase spindle-E n=1 Tax=Anopheles bellator TaxID=139047 RepID=UPI002649919F|nr:probable ATP-dependent RNA helicase spindle-E [Anopheles bellator]
MEEQDNIMDFFDFSKPFERVIVSGGYCNASVVPEKLDNYKLPQREQLGTDYSAGYAQAEEKLLIKAFVNDAINEKATSSRLDDVDEADSLMDDDEAHVRQIRSKELMEPLFKRYNFTVEYNQLPIMQSKTKILDMIRENPVVVLQGPTGCGKTTQVPQYLLEDAFLRQEYCNIVVTQPRRIAASSIAERVSRERNCDLGSLVGYQVGLKVMLSDDTRLRFVTTGVLLQWLITAKSLARYTHIILDEVHEREVDMDFLLIFVRHLLATKSTNTKIILMSATIDAGEFCQYFKIPKSDTLLAPSLTVATSKPYDVSVYYLDSLDKFKIDFSIEYDKPGICEKMYEIAARLAYVCDQCIDRHERVDEVDFKPSIIMFLPGINEIELMAETLHNFAMKVQQQNAQGGPNFLVLKLHSMLPSTDHAAVFRRPPPGQRKVILSTNIAESSITVPDVKYVIDFCLQRIQITDSSRNFTTLSTQWASKSNCVQRAGRTGRLMNGRVYRLIDRSFFEKGMQETTMPEMIRCRLGSVVLKAKMLNMGPPQAVLGLALSPPNLSDICNTILQLKEVGALLRTSHGEYTPLDGDMTYLGQLMCGLPLDLPVAKLVILGYVYSVLQEAIIIAAGMSVKNIFTNNRTIQTFENKMRFADGSGSDGIAILNAYTAWRSMAEQSTGGNTAQWCHRNGLELKSLSEMAELVREIQHRLSVNDVKEVTGVNRVIWSQGEKGLILKVIMAGAFYPNFFIPGLASNDDNGGRGIYTEVGCRDPFSTVFFVGFEHSKHIGSLYRQQFKDMLTNGDRSKQTSMKVEFDRSSNRVFIRYVGEDKEGYPVPGRFRSEVYRALKLREHRRGCFEMRVMNHADAVRFATKHKLGEWRNCEWVPRRIPISYAHLSVVPLIHCARLSVTVTYGIHPGKFFVRPLEERANLFEEIDQRLNASELQPFPEHFQFRRRQLVAAKLPKSTRYRRGQLVSEELSSNRTAFWKVYFVDHGATVTLPVTCFHQLTGSLAKYTELPGQVFQAYLAEVQPFAPQSPKGTWLEKSSQYLKQATFGQKLEADIYSVVDQIASVVLWKSGSSRDADVSINQEMVNMKLAQPSEESYLSKMNHESRIRVQRQIEVDERYRREILNDDSELAHFIDDDDNFTVDLPRELLRITVALRGPYNPLQIKCSATTFSIYVNQVKIESDSVNSVLLESNPQDVHQKLLVSAGINEAKQSQRLTINQTTMMPNIPGMPALMALIFAPNCYLKKDVDETRVVGLVAGLGCDTHTGESLYPEHDISLPVDVVVTEEDIGDINALRYTMDSILHLGRNEKTRLFGEYSIESLMAKVKEYIIKILQRERSITENSFMHDFKWESDNGPGDSGPSSSKSKQININIYEKALYPLHPKLDLRPIKSDRIDFLQRHCQELHELVQTTVSLPNGGVTCKLCNVSLQSLPVVRIHLYSKLHRDREAQIGFRLLLDHN